MTPWAVRVINLPMDELTRSKMEGRCYFCGEPARESTETVSGKPDDHKVCPKCFEQFRSAILGSRARIKAFEHMIGY